jgi:3-oxoadipate enol-lactonase
MTPFSVTTRDGATLAAWRGGRADGPTIALVHSLAMSAAFWDRVVKLLADRFQIITLDCRGHGASSRGPGPYDVAGFADDLVDVLDAAGIDRAIVAGCSMGGCVALAFAINHPDRTRALGLIDTTAWYGEDAPTAWRQRGQQGLEKGLASLTAFQTTRWFSDGFRADHPDIVQAMVEVFVANDPACYAASCDMLGSADLRAGLAGLSMPAAVIVGEEDYATPVAMAEALAGGIGGATLEVIKGGRHLTPVECPERIARFLSVLSER